MHDTETTVTPPESLSAASREWFEQMATAYDFSDPAGQQLLVAAAFQLERLSTCRESIADAGPLIRDRFGQLKPHPGLVEERAASNLLRLLIREMGLNDEPEDPRIGRAY
jgi:hypothetical protein